MTTRIGHGYDFHRLEPVAPAGRGRPLMVGGVAIPHDRGPVAHSDGDALLHALTDAILGAIGEPDIGQLFPDDDPRHESRDSADFLEEAAQRAARGGWSIENIDATVVLERPRLAKFKAAVIARVAAIAGIEPGRVNVKGKSHEGLDSIGQGAAIEAHVVVLLTRAS